MLLNIVALSNAIYSNWKYWKLDVGCISNLQARARFIWTFFIKKNGKLNGILSRMSQLDEFEALKLFLPKCIHQELLSNDA